MDIVGLVPAAGTASRLGKLPYSKEIMPLPGMKDKSSVLSENLVRYFRKAGIDHLYFIIRKGKWDIPEYYGDGSSHGVNIGYLMMNLPFGTPFTVSQAFPFVHDKIVALGFPDILFEPEDAFEKLKNRFLETDADLMLGIVPSEHYLRSDMIEFDAQGRMKDIVIKQNRPDLKHSWFIALWRPAFSIFMNDQLGRVLSQNKEGKIANADGTFRELYMGDIIREAILSGMKTDYLLFGDGYYRDMGTWEELQKLSR
jgi:glucose-1-phosphate thymidylyltransferase